MKKFFATVLALAMTLSLAACGSKEEGGSSGGVAQSGQTSATVEGLSEAIAEQPVLLTSVGQSADAEMVKSILNKLGVNFTLEGLATPDDLGDAKTLILAVGGSSKGLGAAGIDADQELARVQELIDAADAAGMTVIAMHIGGDARRGELSDKFIEPSFAKADYALVVASGNTDGMMTNLAAQYSIPMDEVATMADIMTPLKGAFK